MKLIEPENSRAATLKKRIKGLKKKAYEFSILCGVKVCMIIFEPEFKNSPAKLEIWPSDPNQVKEVINIYRTKIDEQKKISFFSVYDFFSLRNRQVHDEVAQVRKANFKAKFPTWDDRIDRFSPEQIASLVTKLDMNLEVAKKKIMSMKGDDHDQVVHLLQSSKPSSLGGLSAQLQPNPYDNHIQAHVPIEFPSHFHGIQAFPQRNLDLGVSRGQCPIPVRPVDLQTPSLSPADEALVKLSLSLNPMYNLDFGVQSGVASSSRNNIHNNVMYNPPPPPSPLFHVHHDHQSIGMPSNNVVFNPLSTAILHDPRSSAMQNHVMFNEPRASAFQTWLYAPPPMQPEPTYNWQQPLMPPLPPRHVSPPMLPSHLQFTDFYHDTNEHEMKDNKKPRF
ncbi:hypothetical protein PTKIN_Ptkin07bG0300200 [Pterospermum kingtungense]